MSDWPIYDGARLWSISQLHAVACIELGLRWLNDRNPCEICEMNERLKRISGPVYCDRHPSKGGIPPEK